MSRCAWLRCAWVLSLAVLAGTALSSPAHAQSWFDKLLSGEAFKPARAATQPDGAVGGMPATAILPPRRPASLGKEALPNGAAAASSAPPSTAAQPLQPIVTAAAPSAAPAHEPSLPLTEAQIVAKANAYFNGISTLVGDFVQTGGDGRRLTGKLYLQRPGKIRFEYDSPATIEVIADGSSVAVRDRKLATQDLYSISQTPLKFLLRERVNLGQDIRVVSASSEPEGVRLTVEDKSTLGGTSKITLFFDPKLEALQSWRIVDPQGFTTMVSLSNLERNRRVDNRLFVINYERSFGEGSNR